MGSYPLDYRYSAWPFLSAELVVTSLLALHSLKIFKRILQRHIQAQASRLCLTYTPLKYSNEFFNVSIGVGVRSRSR